MANEGILNSATSRFQLNYKRNVGAVVEEIRKCAPKTVDDWAKYYFVNVHDRAHLQSLGEKLYVKISEVIASEVKRITEQECIDYVFNLVINRTFDGYQTEITTIYEQLQAQLNHDIQAAPDEWDRGYNVDFFIEVGSRYIGIQVKPVNDTAHITQIHKERSLQKASHDKFTKKFGGGVFYVFSRRENRKKHIANPEVVEELRAEIRRLET